MRAFYVNYLVSGVVVSGAEVNSQRMGGRLLRVSSLLSFKYLTKIDSLGGADGSLLVWVEQMLSNSHEQVTEHVTDGTDNGTNRARNLGVVLRSAREEQALTIREAAERIRIPAQYLTMLEVNDYSGIADELYLLPFVRSYAEFLGLDAGALSTRFVRGIAPLDRSVEAAPDLAEEPAGRRGEWFTTAAVMLFVALAIYLVGLK